MRPAYYWLVVALCCLGCGKKEDTGSGRPVSGKLTYNNVPVGGATVTFVGPFDSAFGMTDDAGNFKLRTPLGDKVPLGDYQVAVSQTNEPAMHTPSKPEEYQPPNPNAPPPPEPKELLPSKFKDPTTSGLTATVTATAENKFEFNLVD